MGVANRLAASQPIEIEAGLDVEAPIERVMELLDFAAPSNALRERGFFFMEEADSSKGRFKALDPDVPDLVFIFDVDRFDWPHRMRFETRFDGDEPVGSFVRSISDYQLSATGPDTCHLKLVETTFLAGGLSASDYRTEHAMLVLSVQRRITQLCVHAVRGVDAAMAVG